MTDINTIHQIVKKIDELCDHRWYRQGQQKSADASLAEINFIF